jgi:O-methyltransferase involved in polyketide biosynthesis
MTTPVNLTGVPETMLMTLHNRASEARRPDTYLHDPECVRVYDAIDFDYARVFGKPIDAHPLRSKIFDTTVKPWMKAHPGGTVVELASGLETSFQRCDDGRVNWMCVDLPESVAVRERFLPPTERCRYIARSALDLTWMDEVDAARGLFVSAQGLLMYFPEDEVKRLLRAIMERFPGVEIMFDIVPSWFARRISKQGLDKSTPYVTPPMPWAVSCTEVGPLLRSWSDRVQEVTVIPYGFARGARAVMQKVFAAIPGLRGLLLAVVRIQTRAR